MTLSSAGGIDIFVANYDPNGLLLWAKRAGGTGHDEGSGIAVNAAGHSTVTGFFVVWTVERIVRCKVSFSKFTFVTHPKVLVIQPDHRA